MPNLSFSKHIDAPIDIVFDAFSDFSKAAERVDGIESVEMLTDGETRVGTRFKETRIMFGREATEEMEVTAYNKNESLTVSADSCGSRFETYFRFQADGDKTNVDINMQIRPTTFLAKLMTPIGFLMKGTMRKCMNSDFDQIKAYCENENGS